MLCTVIGAEGFIGGHLCQHLQELGHELRLPRRGEELSCGPLGQVFYCAGLTADFATRRHDTVEAHVCLLNRLLRGASLEGLVYLSSTRLYDSGVAPLAREEDSLPLSPHRPRHLFDLSKALGEAICLNDPRPSVRVARLSSVYAPPPGGEGFFHEALAMARRGGAHVLRSHPAVERDYVHIDDVCRGLLALASRGRSRIVNLASGVQLSNARLVELLEAHSEARFTLEPAGPAPGHQPQIDVSRLREELKLDPVGPEESLPSLL